MDEIKRLRRENEKLQKELNDVCAECVYLMISMDALREYRTELIAGLQEVRAYIDEHGEWAIMPPHMKYDDNWKKLFPI